MNFGTLQSITKEPQAKTGEQLPDMNGDASVDDLGGLDGLDGDESGVGGESTSVGSKLLALRDEIDNILYDMGLIDSPDADSSEFDDSEFDDSEFGDTELDGAGLDDAGLDDPNGASKFDDEGDDPLKKNNFSDEMNPEGESEFSDFDQPEEDENFQGDIRTVTGANLVYKRKDETGNYEELWIYKVGDDVQKEMMTRKAILAGTDIVPAQRESEDGSQTAETTTLGNVQYLKITGLPN